MPQIQSPIQSKAVLALLVENNTGVLVRVVMVIREMPGSLVSETVRESML